MEDVEIRNAFVRKADNLGINNQRFAKSGGFFDNTRIALRPVGPVPGVETHATVANVYLQPVPVVLQLVRPTGTGRRLTDDGRATGLDK
jgi:hypothetical protein